MKIEWRAVRGFEGRYEIGNHGVLRSIDRQVRFVSKAGKESLRLARGVEIRPGHSRGYLIVNLSGYGTIALHILVARAFCKGEAPGFEVNHKDGDKHNCAASNLEWVTKTRNMEHAVDIGLNSQAVRVADPYTGVVYPSIARAMQEAGRSYRTVANWSRV